MDIETDTTGRKRSANFSREEKEVFFNILARHKSIIENKKTDGVTLEEKNKTWALISQQFNAQCPNLCTRSEDSLKNFYKNQKKELRKKAAEEKKNIYMTGGGAQPKPILTETDHLLLDVVNQKTVFGVENPFDNDSEGTQFINKSDEVVSNKDNEENIIPNRIWRKYKPQDIREPVSSQLSRKILSSDEYDHTNFQNRSAIEIEIHNPNNESENRSDNLNTMSKNKTPSKKILSSARRRPMSTVRTLTSSALGQKYEILADRKLELVECLKKEHLLRMKSLELDIEIKRKTLESMSNNN